MKNITRLFTQNWETNKKKKKVMYDILTERIDSGGNASALKCSAEWVKNRSWHNYTYVSAMPNLTEMGRLPKLITLIHW
jgi:hypothetical protein